MECYSLNEGEP